MKRACGAEKGVQFLPRDIKTVGDHMPYINVPFVDYPLDDWEMILKKLQTYTKSPWRWT